MWSSGGMPDDMDHIGCTSSSFRGTVLECFADHRFCNPLGMLGGFGPEDLHLKDKAHKGGICNDNRAGQRLFTIRDR